MMTTNIAENLNNCMKFARRLTVIVVPEFLRDTMQIWFHERRSKVKDWTTQLSEWATEIVTKRSDFFSMVGRKTNVQLTSLAANWYITECIRQAYAPPINPVGHTSTWVVSEDVNSRIVIKPDEVKQAGQPKVSRAPSS
ncbi:hypothetical protein Dsin_016935 [Dipteronia sinensis]|uniref:Uncharacterized protein n=1 Tax=Dipteronia sinensis TaxID=43782 RepID=A0AAE0AE55_9ROSI|nr:hypothetical protein Dsin_016935 [Dipteronia sinensis]